MSDPLYEGTGWSSTLRHRVLIENASVLILFILEMDRELWSISTFDVIQQRQTRSNSNDTLVWIKLIDAHIVRVFMNEEIVVEEWEDDRMKAEILMSIANDADQLHEWFRNRRLFRQSVSFSLK